MNEPQVWTLIGVFASVMLGGMSLMTTLIVRSTTAAIDGLRAEMRGDHTGLRAEVTSGLTGLRAEMITRFDAVDARLDATDARIAHLDRDVTFLMTRAWGEPRSE